jgi:hypothetical protein
MSGRPVLGVGLSLGVLAALAALLGAPPLVVFLVGYALPAGLWLLLTRPPPEPGRGRRS